jgi:hypothetical protein
LERNTVKSYPYPDASVVIREEYALDELFRLIVFVELLEVLLVVVVLFVVAVELAVLLGGEPRH